MIFKKVLSLNQLRCLHKPFFRSLSTQSVSQSVIELNNNKYESDDYTNISSRIVKYLERNIHLKKDHPLELVKNRVTEFFYKEYCNNKGTPSFSVYDRLNPIVTVAQNFDSLLIPENHPSRAKSDCYYINREYMLRAHCTAHQLDLLRSGLDNFLICGDVYRRDEIDSTHFPVFHQIDGVRVNHNDKLFKNNPDLEIFEKDYRENSNSSTNIESSGKCIDQIKQACHTVESVKLTEHEMKVVLEKLAKELFGKNVKHRWVDAYFPFTQPSWELEIYHKDKWIEVLGCGVMRNEILNKAGIYNSIGFAFGLGLERLAMILYDIPDIRLFWSKDPGFLNQFNEGMSKSEYKYKPVSQFPPCTNDLSFWLPDDLPMDSFSPNDFYDLVREFAGECVEQVTLVDKFTHPKTGRNSLCFRIVYRHMERTLTKKLVNLIHDKISQEIVKKYRVEIR